MTWKERQGTGGRRKQLRSRGTKRETLSKRVGGKLAGCRYSSELGALCICGSLRSELRVSPLVFLL